MKSNISRDHLAMEAMKVILDKTLSERYSLLGRIKVWLFGKTETHPSIGFPDEEEVAEMAYIYADAMIAEREKNKED